MASAAVQPTIVTIRIGGDNIMEEYVISSPSHPLYNCTSSTYPFDMCNMQRPGIQDVEVHVLDPASHLQPIWDALLKSGHFLMGQFGHKGMITLWAGGSTARCDVEAMLVTANMPAGMDLRIENR